MKLSQIGEFGLIARLSRHEPRLADTVVGIGDDCAVIKVKSQKSKVKSNDLLLLRTTDALIEDVHFKRAGSSFFTLGQKALLANISDIAAMGGWPTHALVTLGLPRGLSVKAIDELYRGLNSLARRHRIDIVGGDTVASPKALMISITLLGEVEKKNLVRRSTARPGDLICVTGRFGGPAAKRYSARYPLPVTRLQEARALAKENLATAMIDSSDGLVRSVLEICRASKVGARIFTDKVPRAKGATLDQALYGGEEYELVFTVKPKAKDLKYRVVGEIVGRRAGVKLVDRHGKIKALRSGGYEHFR
jgi:thiamine-monophosphate kinase